MFPYFEHRGLICVMTRAVIVHISGSFETLVA